MNAIDAAWEERILPALSEYTRIPCLSPAFDPDWAERGAIAAAARLLGAWVRDQDAALATEIVELPGRTPVLLIDNGGSGDPIVVYGHMDKQPPLGEWRSGLGPYEPVREGDLLYGRGTADDGYATFAAVTGLLAAGGGQGRVLVLIEASEESGSPDLLAYLEHLRDADRHAAPRHLPRLGRAELRPAVAHHVAAGQPRRHGHRRGADRGHPQRAGRRRRAVVVPHPAPHAVAGSRTRRPAASSCPSSSGRGYPRRTGPTSRRWPRSSPTARRRWSTACTCWRPIRSRGWPRARGAPRSRSPAPTACPSRATRATCCVPSTTLEALAAPAARRRRGARRATP